MSNNPPTYLVSSPHCGPDCRGTAECVYQIAWSINPHMRIGSGSSAAAVEQHRAFVASLRAAGARILEIPFVHGAFDSVFVKDSALFRADDRQNQHALLAKPKTPERRVEQAPRRRALADMGVRVNGQTKMHFEGGDLLTLPHGRGAFLGYGFRTQWRAAAEVEEFLDQPVTTLRLVDPHFYHLDTALNVIATDEGLIAFALREAFAPESWLKLCRHEGLTRVVTIERAEAMRFALNWVEVGERVFVGAPVPDLTARLAEYDREVVVSPLDEFNLAGGSAACLVARVHEPYLEKQTNQEYQVRQRDRAEGQPRHDGRRLPQAKHAH